VGIQVSEVEGSTEKYFEIKSISTLFSEGRNFVRQQDVINIGSTPKRIIVFLEETEKWVHVCDRGELS
jgi:hypothetical protein